MSPFARFLAAGALAATVAGCAVAYQVEYYSAAAPANVDLTCGQSFQLFENPGYRRILVKPYPVSEATYLACAAFSKEERSADLGARAALAVERHFEKTKRPDCRTTGLQPVGLTDVEVTYDCTPKPAAKPPVKPPAPKPG
jgi:hypothetical protein